MIYYLSEWVAGAVEGTPWAERLSFLRLFRYITVRSGGAALTALLLSWWLGPRVIEWLRRLKFGQEYRDRAEEAGGPARAGAEQAGHAHHGRLAAGAGDDGQHALVGDVDPVGLSDGFVCAGAVRAGVLRRLCQGQPTETAAARRRR
ncbi:MAG: hypothetical protein KatS3mg132_124 [Limisphaera sp.]|nr:MAG: hypothetical protein KatS3mg132_124 [Limisphaera sp.]